MPTARLVLVTALLHALGGDAVAQSVDDDIREADKQLRFRFDEHGFFAVSPDPGAGGIPDTWHAIADPQNASVWESVGLFGWIAFLCTGDGDLASVANARRVFELTGVDGETLVRMLGSPPAADASPTDRARFVLAIRAAEDLALAPAIGPLERAAESAADPAIRRAAAQAAATLRKAPRPDAEAPTRPLDEVLADCPFEPHILAVIDQTRLPPPRAALDLVRRASLALTRSAIAQAGGRLSTSQWAGAVELSEMSGILPYEIARRFGNHRIARTVFASRIGRRSMETWAACDGEFDVEALSAGAEAAGLQCTRKDDVLTVALGRSIELRVTRSTAEVRARTAQGNRPATAPPAPEVAAAPIRIRLHYVPDPAGGTWPVGALPEQIGISVPRAQGEPFAVELRFADPGSADETAALLEELPRRVVRLVEAGELPKSIASVAARLAVERDGNVLRLRIALPPIDDDLAAALAKLIP
ncbi:MAG TPA: hypothetical protein VK081_03225 [Planctomycetota bacterium]|nr:hypothetical protein [Planctomycetota bacterium]